MKTPLPSPAASHRRSRPPLPAATAALLLLAAVGAATLCPAPAGAATATYKEGSTTPFIGGTYTGAEDTFLSSNSGGGQNDNFGARGALEIGGGSGFPRNGLMRFNITSLNGQFSAINSVTLRLYVEGIEPGGNTLQVFRLAAANTGWVEGTACCADGITDTGMSTWDQRVQGSLNWASGFGTGAGAAGTDYNATMIGSAVFAGGLAAGTAVDITLTDATLISDWVAGNNAGLFLKTATDPGPRMVLRSAESSGSSFPVGDTAHTPELIIDYSVAAPEIGVQQPAGTDLVDGTASVGFGNQNVSVASAAKTFTITNTGTADLTGLVVTKDGSHPGDFTVGALGATTLAPGASTTFTVTFTPAATGARSAALHIASNDSDENPFDITLTGTGVQPDYTVTTTGGMIVVTDNSGNGDTLAISEPSAGNIKFAAAGRTFSVDGGAAISGDSGTLSRSGVTQITVNAGAGADTINVGAFTGTLPSLTLNGGTGNDTVNFNGDITFAANANLDVDLQNDDATPGTDNVATAANANLIASGTGTITVKVSKNVAMAAGSSFETVNGDLTLSANQQGIPTPGNFVGIDVNNGLIQATGTGAATVLGKGGDTPDHQFGVQVRAGGDIIGGNALVTVVGTGGAASGTANFGVSVIDAGSTITSGGGNVQVTGQGGGSGASAFNYGVTVSGQIAAGGGGTVNVQGTGGASSGAANIGVDIPSTGGTITSGGGNVQVTGIEGAGAAISGVLMEAGALTTAANGGTLTVVANSMIFSGTPVISAGAASSVTLRQLNNGVGINLGSATDTIGGPLSLSDAELDRVTAGTLIIGDANSGTITVSAAISPANAPALKLASGGVIKDTYTAGTDVTVASLTTDGNLSQGASPGIFSVAGNHTLAANSTFTVEIGGATPGNGAGFHDQLSASGSVTIGANVTLSTAAFGGFVPGVGQSYIIISRTGGSGIFVGLPQGATIPNFLGSGKLAVISYDGGTGDDVVLTVFAPEIGVQQPAGTDLVDGTASIGFGNQIVSVTSAAKTFTITNSGNADLTGLAITKDGAHSGDFTVGALGATTLAPGAGTTFTITFTPAATGSRSAAIHIASNDSDENPFDIALTGTGAAEGGLDTGFNPDANLYVNSATVQADGKIVLGGSFTAVGGTTRNSIARLNADGTLDTGFNPNVTGYLFGTAVQADGKIVLGGNFTAVGGTTRNSIARVNADGTLDTGFNPNLNSYVRGTALQADGKIVIGGGFTTVGVTTRNRIARLNADGTLDTGFNPNANNEVYSTALQADGKMVIGGTFTTVGGTTRNQIARLNADGTLDTGFNPNANSFILTTTVQADGKIVIGGGFTTVGGTARNRIARLNSDGTLDTGFNPNVGLNYVYSMAVQADGKIVIVGDFTTVGGTTRNRIARLNVDGTLDTGFNPDANSEVDSTALQADGKILIGGTFTTVGGTARNRIARLVNGAATQTLTVPSAARVEWLRGGTAPETIQVTFELSTDGGTIWTALGPGTRISGGWELTGLSLPASGTIRARARTLGGIYNGSAGLVEQQTVFSGLPVPEIAVEQPAGTDLVDGAASIDFGNQDVSTTSAAKTFTITNSGTASLTGLVITKHASHPIDFIVGALGATTLAPNASTTFTVTFTPGAGGSRSAALQIASNDSDENPFDIALTGTGVNSPPTVASDNATVTVGEGQTAGNTGTFADANGNGTVTVTATAGTLTQNNGAGTWSWSFATTDGPDDSQTVTISANDGVNAAVTTTFTLTVSNRPPAVAADNASVSTMAGVAAANTGTFSDPAGTSDTVTISASYGSVTQAGSGGGGTWSWNGLTNAQGSHFITITATDSDSETTAITFTLNVSNAPPTLTLDSNLVFGVEGMSVTNGGIFGDVEPADGLIVTASEGTVTTNGNRLEWTHTYSDDGTNQVEIYVTDDNGAGATNTFEVRVTNVVPHVDAGADRTTGEGMSVTNTGTYSDPAGTNDMVVVTTDAGTVTATNGAYVWTHTYGNGPSNSTVRIFVMDEDGGSNSTTFTVTISNVPPALELGANTNLPPGIGMFSRNVPFADPATGETYTGTVDYGAGDGPQPLAVDSMNKTLAVGHTYSESGTFTVAVTLDDGDGGMAMDSFLVTTALLPRINAGPDNATNECGTAATFTVVTGGPGPQTNQWYFSLTNSFATNAVADATNAALTVTASGATAGDYYLAVCNAGGCVTSSVVTLVVVDTTAPAITCPANVTAQCDGDVPPANFAGGSASDICGPIPTVTHVGDSASGSCPKTITRTYRATDASGNTNDCAQTITVHDTTPPVLTCLSIGPFQCIADVPAPSFGGSVQADNCGPGQVTVVHIGDVTNGTCPTIITRTWRGTDTCGNTNDCAQTITVNDTTPPMISCPAAVAVQCFGDIPAADTAAATASDNCGTVTKSHVGDTYATNGAVITVTRTYKATDACTNMATCDQIITVNDTLPPTITCAGNVSVSTSGGTCASNVTFSVTASDNCGTANVTCSPASGSSFALGATTVNCFAEDGHANTNTCSFTVTVSDTEPPAITCAGNVSVSTSGGTCASNVTFSVTAIDNCGTANVTCSPASGSSFALGATTVSCFAEDGHGNTNTCTFTVTVNDTEAPAITCAGNASVSTSGGSCASNVTFSVTATDNCGTANVTCSPASGSSFALGATTVNCFAEDGHGNTNTCSFTVTVTDTEAPTITCAGNASVSTSGGTCASNVTFSVTASDNCGTANVTCSPVSGSSFALGATTVSCFAEDGHANTNTCSFTVTVSDTEAPAITCAGNASVSTSGGSCASNVTFSVTVTDNCGTANVTCSPASGSSFALGATTVNCFAEDGHGNTNTCSFTVTVSDTEAPAITCAGNVSVSTSGGTCASNVTFSVTATDNCGTANVTCSPASGSSFALGATTVTCFAEDGHGNTNTCSFTVTVSDTELPQFICPGAITNSADAGQCSATFALPPFAASDNCGVASVTSNAPVSFPVGSTTVTWTVVDLHANTNTCTQLIIIRDDTLPTVSCPAPIVTNTTTACSQVVAYLTPGGSDNCTVTNVSCSPASGSAFAVGTNTVTCTATDASGNTGTSTFTVTVLDTTPPMMTCPADQSLCTTNPAGRVATFTVPTATDACNGAVAATCVPASGSFLAVGTNAVICSATDAVGNSNGCAFRIIITLDRVPVFAGLAVTTRSNTPVTVAKTKITSRLSDPDGDPVTLTGVATTSLNGGTITTSATHLTYTPPTGFTGIDTIEVAFSDGRCGTATGLLVMTVDDGTGLSLNQVGIRAVPGGIELRFAGIPGYPYTIQRALTATGPWSGLTGLTAPSNGLMRFVDTNPPSGMGFYRTVSP